MIVKEKHGLNLHQNLVRPLPQLFVFSETLANFLIFSYFHFFIGKMKTPAGIQQVFIKQIGRAHV